MKVMIMNARLIQRRYRIYRLKCEVLKGINSLVNQKLAKFAQLQDSFVRDWKEIQQSPRTEIHIASINTCLNTNQFNVLQNSQLSRCFKAADPLIRVIVIYIVPIDNKVLNYYRRACEIQGFSDRVNFVYVDAQPYGQFKLSTTTIVYISHNVIQIIKSLITDQQNTYIVLGEPCLCDARLSAILNVPVFGANFETMAKLYKRIEIRKLFHESQVAMPKGDGEFKAYRDLVNSLQLLILEDLSSENWIFRVDNTSNSNGIAFINTSEVHILRFLRKNQMDDKISDMIEQKREQVRLVIRENLPKWLYILRKDLYKDGIDYLNYFLKNGGVIEAMPNVPFKHLRNVLISFIVDPNGITKLLGTFDCLSATHFTKTMCLYPQQSLPLQTVIQITSRLSQTLSNQGFFGFATVELITYPGLQETQYQCIGLTLSLTSITSSYFTFRALCEGKFDTSQAMYVIDDNDQIDQQYFKTIRCKKTNFLMPSAQKIGVFYDEPIIYEGVDLPQIQPEDIHFRGYAYIQNLTHSHLHQLGPKNFFHICRSEKLVFDFVEKLGFIFQFPANLADGFGLMVVDVENERIINQVTYFIEFISRSFGLESGCMEVLNNLIENLRNRYKLSPPKASSLNPYVQQHLKSAENGRKQICISSSSFLVQAQDTSPSSPSRERGVLHVWATLYHQKHTFTDLNKRFSITLFR